MLEHLNADSLKVLSRKLDLPRTLTRRSELMTALEEELRSHLPGILGRLSDTEGKVLAQAVHCGGEIDRGRFAAIHGVELPDLSPWTYRRKDVSLLHMLGHGSPGRFVVFDSLLEPLMSLVPEPLKPTAVTTDTIPETYCPASKGGRELGSRPVRIYESAEIAPLELRSVLQLVRQGKLSVADKSLRPTEAGTRVIAQTLVTPDFDAEFPQVEPESCRTEAAGSFRAHAWGVVVQQCGWAKPRRGTLVLTGTGEGVLQNWTPEGCRDGIDGLYDDSPFDEFNRVNHIRGQSGRGRRHLTNPADRRLAILESVTQWPIGKWLHFDEAWRFLLASGHGFLVTREAVTLYFGEQQYGHLGGSEAVLPQIYLRAFLMETLATLGIIDIAYCHPHHLWPDIEAGWGTDEMSFCSRYDGLLYVRLNALGAYCLNVTPQYAPSHPRPVTRWEILGNGEIIPSEQPLPHDTHQLDAWAVQDSRGAWWLDAGKVLDYLASGGSGVEIVRFLEEKCHDALPEVLEGWLRGIEAKVAAVKGIEQAFLVELRDTPTAEAIAGNPESSAFCRLAGERHLVVATKSLRAFSSALKKLGYALPARLIGPSLPGAASGSSRRRKGPRSGRGA